MNELGFKIKELRKSKKITQKQLATMVSKSERMIQKYESGEVAPTISTFSQISNALGSTMKELMEEDAHLEVIGKQEITIKERLKKLRKEKNLYQKELADKLNISRAVIASYETGKAVPSIDIIIRYADYFECTTDYILGRTDNKNHIKDININEAVIRLLEKVINEIKKEEYVK